MEKIINKPDGKLDPIHSFGEALTAARENIGPSIKSAVSDSSERLSTLVDDAKRQVMATGRNASQAVDRNVRSQPWAYIAGASVVGMALGYFLVRRK